VPAAEHAQLSGALFVANTNGTGLRQITPYGLANSNDNGLAHWSPDGTHLAQVTNTPDFEDLADWGTHPLAACF
jgi:Tol biopolymer transport system component